MKRITIAGMLLVIGLLLVAACTNSDPDVNENDLISAEEGLLFDFETDAQGFQTGIFAGASLAVADGQYMVTSFADSGSHYLVGSHSDLALKNVAVDVDVRSVASNENAWFGIVCRTHENDLGYAMLVSNDGFWSIARISESASGFQSLTYLEDWRESSDINTDGNNHLRAYCVDDYMALYVNDTFLGDHRDGTYDLSGGIGVLAGNTEGESVSVSFDNLAVKSAYRSGNPNTDTPVPSPTIEPTATETLEPLDALPGLSTPVPDDSNQSNTANDDILG